MKIVIVDRSRPMPPMWHRVIAQPVFLVLLFGSGLLFDSAAMQWAGFVILNVFAFNFAVRQVVEGKPMTIAEARAKLDELEAKP